MGTHHRRTVNNPFANRSLRTVGYSDHRYGNSHHHNKHRRGRKGCLRNNATCFIIFLGCIFYLFFPSSKFKDPPVLNDINLDREKPTEQQSLPNQPKELERNNDHKTIDKNFEKLNFSSESSPKEDLLVGERNKDMEAHDVVETMAREEINRENIHKEKKSNDSSGISNDFVSGKSQTNDKSVGAIIDRNHEKDLNEEKSNSDVDGLKLGENDEPHERYKNNASEINGNSEGNGVKNDDSIDQGDTRKKKEYTGEDGVGDVMENDDAIDQGDTLWATNETDFINNLDEPQLDGGLEVVDKKKEYTGEEYVDKDYRQNEVTGFSNNDENYGMEKKNLTTANTNNVTTDDSSTNLLNSSKSLTSMASSLDQILSNERVSAENNTILIEISTSGNNTVQNVTTPTVTSNITSGKSIHFSEEGLKDSNEDKSKSLLNTTVAEIDLVNKTTKLLLANEKEKGSNFSSTKKSGKDEGKPKLSPNASVAEIGLGNEVIDHIVIADENSEVNGEASKKDLEYRISPLNTSSTATSVNETAPSSNFGNVAISNVINANTSQTNIHDTSISDMGSLASTSDSTNSSKSVKLENITNDTTGAMNESGSNRTGNLLGFIGDENSEVNGEASTKTLEYRKFALNTSSTTTSVDEIAPLSNFGNVTISNVTNANTSHTNMHDTSISDMDSLASSSNSTNSSKSVKLENITNDTTGAMNESGSNRTGNLRGFTGKTDAVQNL